MAKKARTFMTLFAGSIGIIGIALILALSNGVQAYIPLSIEQTFASISLVVSSIMIGITTYISVLERTREIGILRSIGASRKDISRVINAESLIIGTGAIGIGVTLLLTIPINMNIKAITDISGIAALPATGGIALVLFSMALTFIAGLIPLRITAKKKPVVAVSSD